MCSKLCEEIKSKDDIRINQVVWIVSYLVSIYTFSYLFKQCNGMQLIMHTIYCSLPCSTYREKNA